MEEVVVVRLDLGLARPLLEPRLWTRLLHGAGPEHGRRDAVEHRRLMELYERVRVLPVTTGRVATVDKGHVHVRVVDQGVRERHAHRARAHDEVVGVRRSHRHGGRPPVASTDGPRFVSLAPPGRRRQTSTTASRRRRGCRGMGEAGSEARVLAASLRSPSRLRPRRLARARRPTHAARRVGPVTATLVPAISHDTAIFDNAPEGRWFCSLDGYPKIPWSRDERRPDSDPDGIGRRQAVAEVPPIAWVVELHSVCIEDVEPGESAGRTGDPDLERCTGSERVVDLEPVARPDGVDGAESLDGPSAGQLDLFTGPVVVPLVRRRGRTVDGAADPRRAVVGERQRASDLLPARRRTRRRSAHRESSRCRPAPGDRSRPAHPEGLADSK